MIALCQGSGLPEPGFELRDGFFVATLWRDWLTTHVTAELELSERQLSIVAYLKTRRVITNSDCQRQFNASKRTASRMLDGLVIHGVIEKIGRTGKGVHYRLAKGATKGPKGPGARSKRDSRTGRSQGPQRGHTGQSAKPRSKGRREL